MARIILYSDFKPGTSDLVDQCFLEQLHGSRCRIGYIPSDSDLKRRYFSKIEDQYLKLGISDLFYFDLGEEYNPDSIPRLMDCDAIHLSGGDPFKFLELVKKRNFAKQLTQYLAKGGLLVGISAGAMILSKSLGLADEDQLFGKSRAHAPVVRGLGIYDFEFFPHYKEDDGTRVALAAYAKRTQTGVIACDDDAGVFLSQENVTILGRGARILKDGTSS